jgi:hypothetical protein
VQSMERAIAFNLMTNANDSLMRAVDLMSRADSRLDQSCLKSAITDAAHCVELLLKERLRLIHPALIWENVDRYPSLDARTVTVDSAIKRLRDIGNVAISSEEERTLTSLRKTRNAIEHYEWRTTLPEARTIGAPALSFALDFAARELEEDLSMQFKDDDTWKMFVDELHEFARVHGEKIEKRLLEGDRFPGTCDSCGNVTVPMLGRTCELCGHWQDDGD